MSQDHENHHKAMVRVDMPSGTTVAVTGDGINDAPDLADTIARCKCIVAY